MDMFMNEDLGCLPVFDDVCLCVSAACGCSTASPVPSLTPGTSDCASGKIGTQAPQYLLPGEKIDQWQLESNLG